MPTVSAADVRRMYDQASPLGRKALDRLQDLHERAKVLSQHFPGELTDDEAKLMLGALAMIRTELTDIKRVITGLQKEAQK